MLLFFRNETGFGGNNGFTGFTTLLGFSVTATGTRAALFMATVLLLLLTLWIGFRLATSKFGRILTAVRDAENRLMFCGYDPRGFKLLVWTLSAVLCGLAGALYVPQVGSLTQAKCRRPTRLRPRSGWRSAVAEPWSARCWARGWSTARKATSRWRSRSTGSCFLD
nr:Urea ABC transporter [Raoultella sp. NCTC 9187]